MSPEVELALDVRAALGEGPLWDAARGALLFVDIHQGHIHEFEPTRNRHRVIETGRTVSALALSEGGKWLAAADRGFAYIDPTSGAVSPIVEVEPADSRRRMNDGAVDPAGRFWAGSMSLDGVAGQGSLYRLERGQATSMVSPVTTSNGPAWSPDGRLMYYVDTRTRRIDVFDFDVALGAISNRRPFVTFETGPGRPDGIVVDAEGGVWVALWQGAAVQRYRPDGALDLVVAIPTACPTKCAFGGPNLDEVYVTSARTPVAAEVAPDDPRPGALYRFRPGTRGLPATVAR